MNTFEEFLEQLDHIEQRTMLSEIFDWIEKNYPQLDRVIKWNQPMYTYQGTYIIGFSTAKAHIAVSPEQETIETYQEAIKEAGYSQSKMIFRIKWTQEIHYPLFKLLIDHQLSEKEGYPHFWRKVKEEK